MRFTYRCEDVQLETRFFPLDGTQSDLNLLLLIIFFDELSRNFVDCEMDKSEFPVVSPHVDIYMNAFPRNANMACQPGNHDGSKQEISLYREVAGNAVLSPEMEAGV